MDELVYLRGTAHVLDDMDRIEEAWNRMPDKSRAYFLPCQTCGIKFLIVETRIESIEYRVPCEEGYFHFAGKDIARAASAKRERLSGVGGGAEAYAKILEKTVANVVNPPVHIKFLRPPPGVLHD